MASPDRRPTTPDIAFLQERGGLTPAHWETILWRLPVLLDETTRKIEKYGDTYGLTGQDSQLYHRLFLGRRHWDHIAGQDMNYSGIQVDKKFPFVHRPQVDRQLAQEVRDYARAEGTASYTLDDYIKTLGSGWRIDGEWGQYSDVSWGRDDKRWYVFNFHNDTSNDSIGTPAARTLLDKWLLTEGNVSNPLDTPPDTLTKKLIEEARINPDKIRDRLKAYTPDLARLHNSPHFGILEKEVT